MSTFEPSSRAYLTWTPETLPSAGGLADGGHLRIAADLKEHPLGPDLARSRPPRGLTQGLLGAETAWTTYTPRRS